MALYAATVTSKMLHAVRVGKFGILAGEVDITNYNTTRIAITGISGKFKSIIGCVAGPSDLGFMFEWIDVDNAFKAYLGDYNNAADGPLIEVGVDIDVGSAHFIAFGLLS